jgi:hypothetical protein
VSPARYQLPPLCPNGLHTAQLLRAHTTLTFGWMLDRWILGDIACHFHEMLTLRAWLAIIAFYRSNDKLARRGEPACQVFMPDPFDFTVTDEVHCAFALYEARVSCAVYLMLLLTSWEFSGQSAVKLVANVFVPLSFCVAQFAPDVPYWVAASGLGVAALPAILFPQSEQRNNYFEATLLAVVMAVVVSQLAGLNKSDDYLFWRPVVFLLANVAVPFIGKLKNAQRSNRVRKALVEMIANCLFWSMHSWLTIWLDQNVTWASVDFFIDRQRCTAACSSHGSTTGKSVATEVIARCAKALSSLGLGVPADNPVIMGVLSVIMGVLTFLLSHPRVRPFLRGMLFCFLLVGLPLGIAHALGDATSIQCAACNMAEALAWVYAIISGLMQSIGLFFTMISAWGIVRGFAKGLNRL